jgi:hypothetical protein
LEPAFRQLPAREHEARSGLRLDALFVSQQQRGLPADFFQRHSYTQAALDFF